MSYFTVLGYENNEVLLGYQQKYFQKLLKIFFIIALPPDLKKNFIELPIREQITFLLYPDISSLVQDIVLHQSEKSLLQLVKELERLIDAKQEISTIDYLKNIGGTHIQLTLDDNNPANSIVGHPDHDDTGMIGWGSKKKEDWEELFTKTLQILQEINEEYFYEINNFIKKIVPMKSSPHTNNSCSYKECIGTLYIGYTTDTQTPEINILEALIHESSHNKLNLIMQTDAIHNNDFSLRYYSPYRPDARHIQGVFLGVHAIIPTVYILLEALERGYIYDSMWKEKILLLHMKNKMGVNVIKKHAKLTQVGETIFRDMCSVIGLCDAKIQQNSPLQKYDLDIIKKRLISHFREVQENYPHVQY